LFLRGHGAHSDIDGDKGPDYDQTIWFTQVGGNFLGWDVGEQGDTLRAGLAFSYGGSTIEIDATGTKVDLDAPSLALTTTYQAAAGWYVDAVVQGTRYSSQVKTQERGETGDPNGWGAGVSLEGGYPIDLGNRLIVEPQAQLAYQRVWFDEFTDVDQVAVDLQGGESLRGRLGARLQKTYATAHDETTALWSPYVEVSVLQEFLDGEPVGASGSGFGADNGGTSLQVGGGLNAQIRPDVGAFVKLAYEKGLEDGTADSFGGVLGLRVAF
jgi:fibronectin-binding autotransporter adhesin